MHSCAIRMRMFPAKLYFNAQLDITNSCNLRCSHCYHPHHKNNGALSLNDWMTVIQKIEVFSKRTKMRPKLIICGGEPLTSPFLIPLIDHWLKIFPTGSRSILTNGTLATKLVPAHLQNPRGTKDYAELLTELGFHFQISIDGPNEISHDKIRGAGTFQKTVRSIRRLKELGSKFSILTVLTTESAKQIEDFFLLASTEGFPALNFERIVATGSASYKNTLSLSGESLKHAYITILKLSTKYAISTMTKGPLWADLGKNLGTADTLGFYDWIISYDGFLKVSSRTNYTLGHVLRDNPEEIILRHPTLKNLRLRRNSGCSGCDLFKERRCSGNRNVAYVEKGSFFAQDPGCWRVNRSHINRSHMEVEYAAG